MALMKTTAVKTHRKAKGSWTGLVLQGFPCNHSEVGKNKVLRGQCSITRMHMYICIMCVIDVSKCVMYIMACGCICKRKCLSAHC